MITAVEYILSLQSETQGIWTSPKKKSNGIIQ
jgi:hypothetical protein